MEFRLWVSVLLTWTTVVWNVVNPNPMAYRGNLAKNDLSSEFAKDIRDIGIAVNKILP